MRGPELIAQTESPASHKIFIAVPPPAPVPTTITSNVFVGMASLLSTPRRSRSGSFARLARVNECALDRPDAGIPASLAKLRASRDNRGSQVQSLSCSSQPLCSPDSDGTPKFDGLFTP